MQCRAFRVRWDADTPKDTAGHGSECDECARWVASQRSLIEDLADAGRLEPPELDVTARVMLALEGLPRPARVEVGTPQLGWAAMAAGAAGIAILAGLGQRLATVSGIVNEGGVALGSAGSLAGTLTGPVRTLLGSASDLALRLFTSVAPTLDSAGTLQPLVTGAVAGFAAVAAMTIGLVLARDIKTAPRIGEQTR